MGIAIKHTFKQFIKGDIILWQKRNIPKKKRG